MNMLTRGFNDLLELFYPALCITCGDRLVSGESFICVNCWNDLPVTNFHEKPGNKVEQLFWGRIEIDSATAYFSYKKGSIYQHLIHAIKYRGLKELGLESGKRFGAVLSGSAAFSSIDLIIPVPLHPLKQKKRGYNQSAWIAMGISETLKKPLDVSNIKRNVHTATQTKKNRFERWQNVENIFEILHPEKLAGKHVLLVDDIITTGSTLEACAYQLHKIEGVKVSIATLGYADI